MFVVFFVHTISPTPMMYKNNVKFADDLLITGYRMTGSHFSVSCSETCITWNSVSFILFFHIQRILCIENNTTTKLKIRKGWCKAIPMSENFAVIFCTIKSWKITKSSRSLGFMEIFHTKFKMIRKYLKILWKNVPKIRNRF